MKKKQKKCKIQLTRDILFGNILSVSWRQGRLAQLVRASALQAEGLRFESVNAHHYFFADIA